MKFALLSLYLCLSIGQIETRLFISHNQKTKDSIMNRVGINMEQHRFDVLDKLAEKVGQVRNLEQKKIEVPLKNFIKTRVNTERELLQRDPRNELKVIDKVASHLKKGLNIYDLKINNPRYAYDNFKTGLGTDSDLFN